MDALLGYIILSEKSYGNLKYNGAWNFGPNNKKLESVENITKKLIKLSNFNKTDHTFIGVKYFKYF